MKLKNTFSLQLVVAWAWVVLCTSVLIFIAVRESSLFLFISYVLIGVGVGILLCSSLKNTYEIKDGYLHIHELNLWLFRYDYILPIKNIDKVALIRRMQFPNHTLRLWVGSAKYTLNSDEKVSKLLLDEINRLKQEEERV